MCAASVERLGYTFPPEYARVVSNAPIHQDPEVYPAPDRVRPERCLERSYGPFEFLPFGGSGRRCLGAALSDVDRRLALDDIVRQWAVVPARVDHDIRHDIATGPRYGVPLRLAREADVRAAGRQVPVRHGIRKVRWDPVRDSYDILRSHPTFPRWTQRVRGVCDEKAGQRRRR